MSEITTEAQSYGLLSLNLEPGSIDFDPAVTDYRITVAEGVEKVLVLPETASDQVSYVVSGNSGLKPGENLITVSVTDENGEQLVYRITVQVGEVVSEAAQELTTGSAQTEVSSESAGGFWAFASTGPMRAVTFGLGGCILAAAVLWAVFALRRHAEKRREEMKKQERRIARERQKERQQLAMRQEEELLRQIEILTEKSKRQGAGKEEGGLRIIELDEDEAKAARETAEEEFPDLADDLLDDFYDDDEDDEL